MGPSRPSTLACRASPVTSDAAATQAARPRLPWRSGTARASTTITGGNLGNQTWTLAGSPYIVTTVEGTTNLVYQTVSGNPGAQQANIPPNTSAKRLTWIERR